MPATVPHGGQRGHGRRSLRTLCPVTVLERQPAPPDVRSPMARPAPALPVLLSAVGLITIAVTFYASRSRFVSTWMIAVFWIGVVVLLAPVAWRLLGTAAGRAERIGLVVLLGVSLYGLKVLHSPLQFDISDEFFHLVSAQHIFATHRLFSATSIQGGAVAASYPGLEALTAALAQVSGQSLFVCGVIVIGLARVLMMLAVFLFAERVSRSARTAGLAAVLFAANANFLFYSAQFSYESLAFPLFLTAVVLLAARADRALARGPATVSLVLVIAALIPTHHLTSFLLVGVLWLVSLLSLRRGWRSWRAFGPAVLATAAAAAWFAFVAVGTGSYLDQILNRTVNGISGLVSGGSRRVPFQSSSQPSLAQPLPERLVAYLALALLAIGLVVAIVRRSRSLALRSPIGILTVLASLGLLALYPLRASANAWETANRGQEILFPGAAVLMALMIEALGRGRGPRRVVGAAIVVVVVSGGVISGWPYPLRLSQPLQVRASTGDTLVPQGLEASSWATRQLRFATTYVADVSSGRELAVAGARMTYLASNGDNQSLLQGPTLPAWQVSRLRALSIDAVVLDRRKVSSDNLSGYFFQSRRSPDDGGGYYSGRAREKFESIGASEIFTSGDLAIFDVRGLHGAPPTCAAVGRPSLEPGVTCRSGDTLLSYAETGQQVTLPTLRLRLLDSRVTHSRRRGLGLRVLVQVQNFTAGALTIAPRASFSLGVGSGTVADSALARGSPSSSTPPLPASTSVPPHASATGLLSFRIRRRGRAKTVLRRGFTLRFALPQASSTAATSWARVPQIAVIPVRPSRISR